ncbi:MAG: ribosome biogenesis GTP-binding protein YihA/YsxC [Oligoflexia bacterium]|nr:ribosome biogenesis GTP-binding protein YihA/YsxC [Oligoflexia bacterium]
MITVVSAEFLKGLTDPRELPDETISQIAFVGRSNVGKSSLINCVTNRKALARVSSTPGRTQEINLFEVKLKIDNQKPRPVVVIDLPGFGFAKIAHTERDKLQRLIYTYVQQARENSLLCILNDCRREPEEEELELRRLAYERGLRTLIVLTKADKLKRSEIAKQVTKVAAGYGLEPQDLIISGHGYQASEFWSYLLQVEAL